MGSWARPPGFRFWPHHVLILTLGNFSVRLSICKIGMVIIEPSLGIKWVNVCEALRPYMVFVITTIIALVIILLRGEGRGEKWTDSGATQVIELAGVCEWLNVSRVDKREQEVRMKCRCLLTSWVDSGSSPQSRKDNNWNRFVMWVQWYVQFVVS